MLRLEDRWLRVVRYYAHNIYDYVRTTSVHSMSLGYICYATTVTTLPTAMHACMRVPIACAQGIALHSIVHATVHVSSVHACVHDCSILCVGLLVLLVANPLTRFDRTHPAAAYPISSE